MTGRRLALCACGVVLSTVRDPWSGVECRTAPGSPRHGYDGRCNES